MSWAEALAVGACSSLALRLTLAVTMESIKEKEFKELLQSDRVFTDYLNTFLNLPVNQ